MCVQRSVNDIFVGVLRLFALFCVWVLLLSGLSSLLFFIVLVFMMYLIRESFFLSHSLSHSFSLVFLIKMYFTRCVFKNLLYCVYMDSGNYVRYDANPIIQTEIVKFRAADYIYKQASKQARVYTHTYKITYIQTHLHNFFQYNEKTCNYSLFDLLESVLVVKNNRSLSYLVFNISPKAYCARCIFEFTFTNHRFEKKKNHFCYSLRVVFTLYFCLNSCVFWCVFWFNFKI